MDTDQRFDELKTRFQLALRYLESNRVAIQMLNIQDGRLLVRAATDSTEIRDRIMEEFRKLDPSLNDVHLDIRVEGVENVPSSGQASVQTSQNFSQQGEDPPESRRR
jgi:gamma-glutamyl:cysteine ligase YbdK (ATP-grasp superfamily)